MSGERDPLLRRRDERADAPRADPSRADPSRADGAPSGDRAASMPAASIPAASIDVPSADVAAAQTSALPGAHRGGFRRELTEPVPITATVPTGSGAAMGAPAAAGPPARIGAWALLFGILGMAVATLVGWGFPLGLVGVVLAIVALRRPWESRQTAVWGLCLSLVSLAYSAGWLWWASTQGPLFG